MVRHLVRLVFFVYWGFLDVLLLAPHPDRVVSAVFPRLQPTVYSVPDLGVHFTCMAVLAVLAFASRFPWRGRTILGVLLVYGILIESAQWFVPPRTVELPDYVENVLGLLVGTAIWWGVWGRKINNRRRRAACTGKAC